MCSKYNGMDTSYLIRLMSYKCDKCDSACSITLMDNDVHWVAIPSCLAMLSYYTKQDISVEDLVPYLIILKVLTKTGMSFEWDTAFLTDQLVFITGFLVKLHILTYIITTITLLPPCINNNKIYIIVCICLLFLPKFSWQNY